MENNQFDISADPIRLFLDLVDSVLNSNTFLLAFDLESNSLEEDLWAFLHSDSFIEQLTEQDKTRGWYNLQDYDPETHGSKLRRGSILEDIIQLSVGQMGESQKRDYLVAMLTGDTTKGRFYSYYDKQVEKNKAEAIVDNFTSFLSVYTDEWKLYFVQPDFLKNREKSYRKGQDLKYFEGAFANDTATIIRTTTKGFLLLTNGID